MLRAGAILAAAAGIARPGSATAAPAATFSDDFTNVRDGVLDGRISPIGHRWRAFGADSDPPMVIHGRAIGPPRGHVAVAASLPLDSNPYAAAGYATVDLGGAASRIDAEYRWDRSTASTTGLAFGAFDFGSGLGNGFPGTKGGANAHLAVTPTYLQFAVFSVGVAGDYQVLVPRGGTSGAVYFRRPQNHGGRTDYR